MYPVLFRIGPVALYSYGLALALAFIISTRLAAKEALKNNISQDVIYALSGYILVSGIIGARLLYVAMNFNEYRENLFEILMLQHGGLSFYGGALGAFAASIIFLKIHRLDFFKTADLISPFAALGQSIGRLGCLLRGCCFGAVATSGLRIKFPDEVVYRYPTQIYASAIDFSLFLLLRYLHRKRHFEGKIFLLYIMFYSMKRFFLDFLRDDVRKIYLRLTVFQIASIFIFVAALSFFLLRKSGLRKNYGQV